MMMNYYWWKLSFDYKEAKEDDWSGGIMNGAIMI